MKLAPSWQPALAEAPAPKTSAIILESDFPRKWRGLKILKVGSNAFYLSMHKLFIDIALLRHNLSARPSASCTQPYNNLMFQFTLRNPERRQVFPRCFFKTVDNVVNSDTAPSSHQFGGFFRNASKRDQAMSHLRLSSIINMIPPTVLEFEPKPRPVSQGPRYACSPVSKPQHGQPAHTSKPMCAPPPCLARFIDSLCSKVLSREGLCALMLPVVF